MNKATIFLSLMIMTVGCATAPSNLVSRRPAAGSSDDRPIFRRSIGKLPEAKLCIVYTDHIQIKISPEVDGSDTNRLPPLVIERRGSISPETYQELQSYLKKQYTDHPHDTFNVELDEKTVKIYSRFPRILYELGSGWDQFAGFEIVSSYDKGTKYHSQYPGPINDIPKLTQLIDSLCD